MMGSIDPRDSAVALSVEDGGDARNMDYMDCDCGDSHARLTYDKWVRHYRDLALCNRCIAYNFGCHQSWVNQVRYKGDPLRDARDVAVRELFPFRVERKFHQGGLHHNLCTHGEWRYASSITDPEDSAYFWKGSLHTVRDKVARLRSFHSTLRDQNKIIVFDEIIPPHKEAKNGGWALDDRKDSDEDYIVRIPEDSPLDEYDRRIWALPRFKGEVPEVDDRRIKPPNVCGHPDR